MKKFILVIINILLLALLLQGCAGKKAAPKQKESTTIEKYQEQGHQDNAPEKGKEGEGDDAE